MIRASLIQRGIRGILYHNQQEGYGWCISLLYNSDLVIQNKGLIHLDAVRDRLLAHNGVCDMDHYSANGAFDMLFGIEAAKEYIKSVLGDDFFDNCPEDEEVYSVESNIHYISPPENEIPF